VIADACRLDRRVEREQVRLHGDAGERLDDATDALRALGEVVDRGGDLLGWCGDTRW
jgi:hypothetical protein